MRMTGISKGPTGFHSVSMFWYSSDAFASYLMYQSRSIGSCLAALSGYDGSVFACDHYVYPEYKLGNVLDFVDWIARRCGGGGSAATGDEEAAQSVLAVAQTISVIISLAERGDDQNVVTLSTLHAAKGLEWPHVMLVGVTEGMLPFKLGDDDNPTGRAAAESRRIGQRLDHLAELDDGAGPAVRDHKRHGLGVR